MSTAIRSSSSTVEREIAFMQGAGQILGGLSGGKNGKGGGGGYCTASRAMPCGMMQLCTRLLHARRLRCAGPLSSQVGGPANYSYFSFWLFIAFAGWAISLGSLSALQHYENRSGLSDGPGGALLFVFSTSPGCSEGFRCSCTRGSRKVLGSTCCGCHPVADVLRVLGKFPALLHASKQVI